MRDTYGITVAGGQGELKGKIIRIGHMGCLDEYDILTGISGFEKALNELGYKFELGAGVEMDRDSRLLFAARGRSHRRFLSAGILL